MPFGRTGKRLAVELQRPVNPLVNNSFSGVQVVARKHTGRLPGYGQVSCIALGSAAAAADFGKFFVPENTVRSNSHDLRLLVTRALKFTPIVTTVSPEGVIQPD